MFSSMMLDTSKIALDICTAENLRTQAGCPGRSQGKPRVRLSIDVLQRVSSIASRLAFTLLAGNVHSARGSSELV